MRISFDSTLDVLAPTDRPDARIAEQGAGKDIGPLLVFPMLLVSVDQLLRDSRRVACGGGRVLEGCTNVGLLLLQITDTNGPARARRLGQLVLAVDPWIEWVPTRKKRGGTQDSCGKEEQHPRPKSRDIGHSF